MGGSVILSYLSKGTRKKDFGYYVDGGFRIFFNLSGRQFEIKGKQSIEVFKDTTRQ